MKIFATVEDYIARYGSIVDEVKASTLLDDASAMLNGAFRRRHAQDYAPGINLSFDENVKAVCCAVVSRALNVPTGFDGATQYSQNAGAFGATVTFANPTGSLYLGKSDLKKLGLASMVIGSISPRIGETNELA